MPAKKTIVNRTLARRSAFQILFEDDMNPGAAPLRTREVIEEKFRRHEDLAEFTKSLVAGVRAHKSEIDSRIQACTVRWTLARMAATDRNVLRLGTYELIYTTTPDAVVIDQAVELARQFGSRESAGFVNGILDRIAKEKNTPASGEGEKPPE